MDGAVPVLRWGEFAGLLARGETCRKVANRAMDRDLHHRDR